MSAYRFCRTDDIGLLVDALNRCWAPYAPGQPPVTAASFKRSIRDLQVWCSSCMVAFAGAEPIGVLIGAKRPSATLIHRIAVHPDHLRQGHARHLLTSLASKLSILGPPRMVAEIPEPDTAARALFQAAGYAEESVLSDYVQAPQMRSDPGLPPLAGFIVPVTVDDLAANGLLATPHAPWERSVETLLARKDEIEGLAVASDERLEACILYIKDEIVMLRAVPRDGVAHLRHLLMRVPGVDVTRMLKVSGAELPPQTMELLGFRPVARHVVYAAAAKGH